MIVLTFITTYTMMLFHPDKQNALAKQEYYYIPSFLANIKEKDVNKDIHIIDDETLNRFIKFYSNKNIEDLQIYEKEEIRYLLETMGNYKIIELKQALKQQLTSSEEEIYKLLNENLFDKQIMILDEILK